MSSLAENIKSLMKEKNWSGKELADHSRQKTSDIYNILSGKSKKPSADKIEAIAQALNVNTAAILYGNECKPNEVNKDDWDGLLYSEAMNLVREIYNKHSIKFQNRDEEKNITMKHTIRVYNYAKKRNEITGDRVFAEDIITEDLV